MSDPVLTLRNCLRFFCGRKGGEVFIHTGFDKIDNEQIAALWAIHLMDISNAPSFLLIAQGD
ncbi:MAG: hypothetical protein AAFU64_19510 [Bacteroidota bacterium]